MNNGIPSASHPFPPLHSPSRLEAWERQERAVKRAMRRGHAIDFVGRLASALAITFVAFTVIHFLFA